MTDSCVFDRLARVGVVAALRLLIKGRSYCIQGRSIEVTIANYKSDCDLRGQLIPGQERLAVRLIVRNSCFKLFK